MTCKKITRVLSSHIIVQKCKSKIEKFNKRESKIHTHQKIYRKVKEKMLRKMIMTEEGKNLTSKNCGIRKSKMVRKQWVKK